MPRLGIFEMKTLGRRQAVAQTEELDRMKSSFWGTLFHLHPAGAAFGRADFDVGVAKPVQEATAGAERGAKLVASEAEGSRHSGTAPVDELDFEFGDAANQVEPRGSDFQGPKMARLVVSHLGSHRKLRCR